MQTPLWLEVVLALATGILSSVLVLLGDRAWNRASLRKQFRHLEGEYEQLPIQGGALFENQDGSPRITTLKYVGGGVFATRSKTDYGTWTGRLKFDPMLPEYGMGPFEYDLTNNDSGIHQVVQLDGGQRLLVHTLTLSHIEAPPFAYVWRRRRQ